MHIELSETANDWLATGRRGVSSETIFEHITGLNLTGRFGGSHPHDPADFGRCRKLIDQVPEFKARLPEMSTLSPVWAALVEQWDDLCVLMDEEAPAWPEGKGSAPLAYDRMKQLGC